MLGLHQTPFKHVFGTAFKNEQSYLQLLPSPPAQDTNYVQCNSLYWATSWAAGGGGALYVCSHSNVGKVHPDPPCLVGHKGAINDFAFHPFNPSLVATCSDDATVMIWGIPEGGLQDSQDESLVEFTSHSKKVNLTRFHPTAENVLVTAAYDRKVKTFDIEKGEKFSFDDVHTKELQDLTWNKDGSKMASSCKDKKLRIFDPRGSKTDVVEAPFHQGTKGGRVVWLTKEDKILTVGFSRSSERQYMMFDPRNLGTPMHSTEIDVSSGMLMPFYDEDTSMIYLAGKGDTSVKYYEYIDKPPYLYFLSQYSGPNPLRGAAFMPKLTLDVMSCEVARMYRLENNSCHPVSFTVPRKAESFQKDLFPNTRALESSAKSEDYFSGKNAEPKYVSMEPNSPARANVAKVLPAHAFKPTVQKAEKEHHGPTKLDPHALAKENDELRAKIHDLERRIQEKKARQ